LAVSIGGDRGGEVFVEGAAFESEVSWRVSSRSMVRLSLSVWVP
jgi:hypothetical protein